MVKKGAFLVFQTFKDLYECIFILLPKIYVINERIMYFKYFENQKSQFFRSHLRRNHGLQRVARERENIFKVLHSEHVKMTQFSKKLHVKNDDFDFSKSELKLDQWELRREIIPIGAQMVSLHLSVDL